MLYHSVYIMSIKIFQDNKNLEEDLRKLYPTLYKKYSSFEKKLAPSGILNYVFELKKGSKKYFLKIYRNLEAQKKSKLKRELNAYSLAKKNKILTPEICDYSYKEAYLLIKKVEGPNLREVLLDKGIDSQVKISLLEKLAENIILLNQVKNSPTNSKEYISKKVLSLEKKIDRANKLKKEIKEPKTIYKTLNLLNSKLSYFEGETSLTLVHGDFNPYNIIINKDLSKIGAIIDWERSHFGHYLEDLGQITRQPLFGFSKNLEEIYKRKRFFEEESLDFFNKLFNLEFILNHQLLREKYSLPKEKEDYYNLILENHFKALR